MKTQPLIILLVLGCAFLGSMGQIFFKLSSENFSFNPTKLIKNYKFIIGAMLYAVSAVIFVWALRFGDLSALYPIIATSYIWISFFSVFLLNEPFPPLRWLGVGLIIAGITVIVK
jgi:uncharacterized membrane protein